MKIGETKILNKDNIFKKSKTTYVWGKKGEKVKIISISGNAVIYENQKGNRYPCNINDLNN